MRALFMILLRQMVSIVHLEILTVVGSWVLF